MGISVKIRCEGHLESFDEGCVRESNQTIITLGRSPLLAWDALYLPLGLLKLLFKIYYNFVPSDSLLVLRQGQEGGKGRLGGRIDGYPLVNGCSRRRRRTI